MKKPSLKGMKNTKHLGHFAKEKYLCQGHNDSGSVPLSKLSNWVDDIRHSLDGDTVMKDAKARVEKKMAENDMRVQESRAVKKTRQASQDSDGDED